MPLPIGELTRRAVLNGVTAVTIPVNPEAVGVIEIEIQITRAGIWLERKSVFPRGRGALLPEIEAEVAGAEVPIITVGYRNTVVGSIESERLSDFATGEGRAIHSSVVIVLTVGRVAFAFPPRDHSSRRRRAGWWDFKS